MNRLKRSVAGASLLLMGSLPPALAQGPMVPQTPPAPQLEIAPLEPVVEVLPWPLWAVVGAGLLAAVVVGVLLYLLFQWLKRRPGAPALSPRQQALARLSRLQGEVETSDPYPFGIKVSDVLRGYVREAFGLPATSQTSPEFLATAARSPQFTEDDRELLEAFLEKVDLIKFARLDASRSDSEALLRQAEEFVQGKGGTPA